MPVNSASIVCLRVWLCKLWALANSFSASVNRAFVPSMALFRVADRAELACIIPQCVNKVQRMKYQNGGRSAPFISFPSLSRCQSSAVCPRNQRPGKFQKALIISFHCLHRLGEWEKRNCGSSDTILTAYVKRGSYSVPVSLCLFLCLSNWEYWAQLFH